MKALAAVILLPLFTALVFHHSSKWRAASDDELAKIIPARANVNKELIETEMRTASGVTDGRGKFIAGVVMITAGYSADGKYSDYFVTQVPIKIADLSLGPGEYVFGTHRQDEDTIELTFYEAASAKPLGSVKAIADKQRGPIKSLVISSPENGKAFIKVGRFVARYSLV